MNKSTTNGGQGGAHDYFTTGGGRPYEPHEYKSPDKTNEQRNTKIPIDLDELEQPGSGPVNFAPKKGLKFNQSMAGAADMVDTDD